MGWGEGIKGGNGKECPVNYYVSTSLYWGRASVEKGSIGRSELRDAVVQWL